MRSKIRIAIIEDEVSAVNRLKRELKALKEYEFEVQVALQSVKDAVAWFQANETVDLIFLDIHLTDGLSFEIFRHIDVQVPVIFTTAYDEYALQAFKVNSLDYLLKPIDPVELQNALTRYQDQRKLPNDDLTKLRELATQFQPTKYRSSFLVSYRQKMMMVNVDDVAFLFVKERGVFLKKKDGKEYLLDFYLDDLERQVDRDKFFRANRQYLVSRSAIEEIETYFNGRLILKTQPASLTSVIISKSKAS